ncbi:alpha-amylase family protein [Aureimonas flava]|uniref:alpha-amylase family protein n=1 Tax=Aureimonas flava TaxID=2320271 RepID=UPI001459FDF5|nr:alpha-amylase family protein [Aureimonas flava]
MTLDWTRRPQRFFQHLLREQDAVGLDPADLVAEAQSVGATATIAMGGGFSAWYPTRRRSQTINPFMQGDFLGNYLDASARAGLRTFVRMDISKARSAVAEHEDWYVHDAAGELVEVWAMPMICATGPLWQEENFEIVREILSGYRPDGFFYNYFHIARCWCERCRRLVREATGEDVPPKGLRSPAYETWRQRTLADYTHRLQRFIRAHRPEAALVPYHHLRDGWDARAMAAASDIVGVQISNPVIPNPVDPQPVWSHWTTEEALFARALKPDVPPLLIQTTSQFFASRQTAMPSDRLVRNMAEAIAHRAVPAAAANGRLRSGDARFVGALEGFGAYQSRHAGWYEGLESVARIAVVRSPESVAWGPDAARLSDRGPAMGHVAEFRGVVQMLSAARRPFDVLAAGGLCARELERYDLVILPAVSCLGDADVAALDAFAAQRGKTLLATADTGGCDAWGRPRAHPVLTALGALPGQPRDADGAYLSLRRDDLRAAIGGVELLGVAGDFWTPDTPADGDMRLIGPFANNAPEFTVVPSEGREPGLLEGTVGLGHHAWITWRIGGLFARYGSPDHAAVFEALVARCCGPSPIGGSAPATVDFALQSHRDGWLLHLLNGAAPALAPHTRTSSLAGFQIRVRCAATQVVRLDADDAPAAWREGDELVIEIAKLDTFAAMALIPDPTARLPNAAGAPAEER